MPHYDFKCPFCRHEDELSLPITYEGPVRCTNPEGCDGVMEKQFKSPPLLHASCIPTRVGRDGVNYKEH